MMSERLFRLVSSYEGYRGTAYRCPALVWTIGYGHTKGVKEGDTCTPMQARQWLEEELLDIVTKIRMKYPMYVWEDYEIDALASFAYNCGMGNLDKLLAAGTRSKEAIADKIMLYDKARGKTLAGLVKRRDDEQALFMGRTYQELSSCINNISMQLVIEQIGATGDLVDAPGKGMWRKMVKIAEANGLYGYTGTYHENMLLKERAYNGVLRRP